MHFTLKCTICQGFALSLIRRFKEGSWWYNWVEWLKARSGELIVPPSMGSRAYPPITPASDTYLLEK